MQIGQLIDSEVLVKLANFQWERYGLKLELLSGKEPNVSVHAQLESSDEIIKLMSQKPRGTHRA